MVEKDSPRENTILGRVLDEEKDKYIGGKSPARFLPEDEDDDERTLEDKDSQENTPEEQVKLFHETENNSQLFTPQVNNQLFAFHVNNVSAEYVLFMDLFTLYDDHNNNSEEKEERREGIFTSLVNNVNSPIGRKIGQYLIKYGAVTQRELIENIPTTGATVSRTLNTLRICGIVEKKGRVGAPYRAPNDRGAGITLWGLIQSSPQASIEAQKRYGDLVVSSRDPSSEYTFELEIQQREALEVRDLEVKNLTSQVFYALPRPLTTQSTPIYDAMNLVGIDTTDPIRDEVKKSVLRRILQEAETDEVE